MMNESNIPSNDSAFLKTLTKHISAQLEERSFCVVFEDDLKRCWPNSQMPPRSTRCSEKAWRVDESLDKYADESLAQPKGIPMLWTIIAILVVLWLFGLIVHVGGSLIHLLLIAAVVVLIINLIQGRRGP